MADRFLITGLPRSRTAWFATAASRDGFPCLHEPSKFLFGYDELASVWPDGCGISDSALALHLGAILRDFAPRTLIVERSIVEVIDSYCRFVGHDVRTDIVAAPLFQAQTELTRWKSHPLVRCVAFAALNDLNVLAAALDWLTPGVPRPALAQLAQMNIQSDHQEDLKIIQLGTGRWVLTPPT